MTGFGLRRSPAIAILLALICVVAVLLLIANIGNVTDEEGEGILGPAGNLIAERIAEILFVFWIALFISFMVINFKGKAGTRKGIETNGGFSWAGPLSIMVLIGFIVVIKILTGDSGGGAGSDDGEGGGGAGEIIPGTGGGGPESYLIFIITAVIIGVVLFIVVRELRSRRPRPPTMTSDNEMKVIIERAVDSLEAGGDPRTVVYRSYMNMCNLLERRGLTDISYLTPGEFASIAVGEFHLPHQQVEELTQLFEEARYSDHLVGEGMKERSIRCLRAIKISLENEKRGSIGSVS
ncbi:MAG: DUF4129 domain-containing protein [Methanomassiliicoccales archaeon]|nr:DUF4129 domain-containing protein [Methanomassiliicoccales archaeon]NYT15285.1 DUF4129 domain-containing protein [Methanomassiliicoccales archaeon]